MTSGSQQSHSRLVALTEAAVDAIVSCDAAGAITEWNPAAERMFGYERDEIVGAQIERIVPLRFRDAHRAGMARAARGGEARIIGTTQELAGLRRSGEEFPVELSLSAWEHEGEQFFTGIIRDITDRKRVERTAHRYSRELSSALHHLETMFAMVADLLEGQTLEGRYLLERRLRGDQAGALYEATDLEHRTPVHVRVLRGPSRPGVVHEQERIMYPHAATVLDAGVSEVGLPFAVMEAMSGERLRDRLERRKPISRADALSWSEAVATSLLAAHAGGEPHGYLCTESVFVQSTPAGETVKLFNFELNRLVRAGSAIAVAIAEARGPYCAPELRGGVEPGFASDVYAAAMLLGVLLSGSEPDAELSEWERREWIRSVVPAQVADVAAAALSSNPDARPAMAALAAAIRDAKQGYSGHRGNSVDGDDTHRAH